MKSGNHGNLSKKISFTTIVLVYDSVLFLKKLAFNLLHSKFYWLTLYIIFQTRRGWCVNRLQYQNSRTRWSVRL